LPPDIGVILMFLAKFYILRRKDLPIRPRYFKQYALSKLGLALSFSISCFVYILSRP
jgi:hypothetical protein